jgi:hypothetical protein
MTGPSAGGPVREDLERTVAAATVVITRRPGPAGRAAVAARGSQPPTSALWRPAAPAPAMAPPGWPPIGGSWPAPPRRTGRRRTVAVAAAAAVAVIAAVIVVGVATRPDPEASSPEAGAAAPSAAETAGAPVAVEALPTLLLDVGVINAAVDGTELAVVPDGKSDLMYDSTVNRPECGGVLTSNALAVYRGSSWVATQTQMLREADGGRWKHTVVQGVVSFPSPALATAFRDAQAAAWAHCQGGTVSLAMPGQDPLTWSVYDVQDRDGMLTAVDTQDGGQGWQCQRALTVRNNVVVDVRSCGFTDTESAQLIAATIRDRVDAF